jgi:hypothetical protein
MTRMARIGRRMPTKHPAFALYGAAGTNDTNIKD